MGELRQRGRIWWIRYYRNGQRHEESARSNKWEKARDLLRLREGDVSKGVPVSPAIGRLRFDDAVKDVITDYTVNRRDSLAHVERRVKKHLTPWFGGRRMASITTPDIRGYVAERLTAGASNASINRELAILKRAYRLAIQAGKLLQAPHVPMLDEDNVRQGFLERAQFDAIRDHLPTALRPVVTFMYYTGWRVNSELLPLQWHQVDRAAGIVRLEVGTTKNRAGRLFKYSDVAELKDAIDTARTEHEALTRGGTICPWVFQRRGKQIRDFRGAWDAATTAAGCPGRIPHDCRRTAVRNLTRAGVTETVAMKITGHKTRSVFDRYDITSEADLADAARKLERLATGTISGTIGAGTPQTASGKTA
jgi:site-specific recombinase XerD